MTIKVDIKHNTKAEGAMSWLIKMWVKNWYRVIHRLEFTKLYYWLEELSVVPMEVVVMMNDTIRFNELDRIESIANDCKGWETGGGYLMCGGDGEMNADCSFDFPTMYHAARFINELDSVGYSSNELHADPFTINGDFLQESNKIWKMIGRR